MNLYDASRQWAERPPDQRARNLQDLYNRTRARFESARTAVVRYGDLKVQPIEGNDVALIGPSGGSLKFTDYSFKQLSRNVGLGADTLSQLPAQITADAINFGIQRRTHRDPEAVGNVLFHKNGSLILRAITGTVYNRIWNYEVAEFLLALNRADPNWRVPPARPAFPNQPGTRRATAEDVLDMNSTFWGSVKVDDLIADAGLYESSHDMFGFMVNQSRTLETGGGGKEVLNRGFFVRNSEVGDGSLVFTKFLYDNVCSNHIVWDAQDVEEISFKHVGKNLRDRIAAAMDKITVATDAGAAEDEAKLRKLRGFLLGDSKEEVLELANSRKFSIPVKTALAAYELAEEHADVHGDPKTAWGFVSGLTRLSQQTGYTDKRTALDRIGGKILQLAAKN